MHGQYLSLIYILDEKILEDFESTLPNYEIALDFTNYIRSIRDIHQVCLAKEVDLARVKQFWKMSVPDFTISSWNTI